VRYLAPAVPAYFGYGRTTVRVGTRAPDGMQVLEKPKCFGDSRELDPESKSFFATGGLADSTECLSACGPIQL
jgi:hypothetical protein